MKNVAMGLVALSALGFILAAVAILTGTGSIAGVSAEGFSRACTNLALLAIAVNFVLPAGEEGGEAAS